MPFRKITLRPGVNLEASPTLNQTQLATSNLVRFYSGLVQKLGGWQQLTTNAFTGICRGLHGWADIVGNAYLAIGTNERLQVLDGGAIFDLTPISSTSNLAPAFSTVISTTSVIVADSGAVELAVGNWINITTQIAIGGIIIFGFYQIATVIDTSHYTITAATPALSTAGPGGVVPLYTSVVTSPTITVTLTNHGLTTGGIFNAVLSTNVGGALVTGPYSVTVVDANNFTIVTLGPATSSTSVSENGGDAQIEYLLPIGNALNIATAGYGIGDYGGGDYGQAPGGGQVISVVRQWSLDHWGEDLIASPTNGAIYYWQPPNISPAVLVSNTAPEFNTNVFVMPQVQIIVALGAEVTGVQEPLLIRWCDQGDFTDWDASAVNQAGSFQIPTGSALVAGLAVGLGSLLWTDVDLWAMTYLSFPLVFGFNRLSTACGLIAPRAAGVAGNLVVWLSTRSFFTYSVGGAATPIECSVWDFFNNNVDATQLQQIHCAVNAAFWEMAWHFPIDPASPLYTPQATYGYIKVNYLEGFAWDYGLSAQYQRTAWVGRSPIGNPVGADFAGLLQQHEIGYDANGVAMQWGWRTGYFDLAEGEEFVFSDFIIPDMVTIGTPTLTPTVLMTDYPFAETPVSVVIPSMMAGTTNAITYSARGRQMAFGLAGADLGTFSRIGAIRVRYAPDGRN